MGYPGVRIYIHPILFVASGSRKTQRTLFRRYAPAGTANWERSVKTQPPSEDRRYNKKIGENRNAQEMATIGVV